MSEDDFEITPLVRRFSDETPTNDILSESLALAVKQKVVEEESQRKSVPDWLNWLRSGANTENALYKPLQEQQKDLVEAWRRAKRHFPNIKEPENDLSGVPTADTLLKAVKNAQVTWKDQKQETWNRASHQFLDFVGILGDYSFLFQFIPAGDKYVSLIAGVVTTVVKVSVNYQKIADGFSNALHDITYGLDFVRRELQHSSLDSPEIRELLIDLYVKLFKFLTYALSFFCSRKERFKASINKNFYDENVRFLVEDVLKTTKRIHDEAQHITHGRIHMMDRKLDLIVAAFDSRNNSEESREKIFDKMADALQSQLTSLGFRVSGTLGAVEEQTRYNIEVRAIQNRATDSSRLLDLESETNADSHDLTNFPAATLQSGINSHSAMSRYDIQKLANTLKVAAGDEFVSLPSPRTASLSQSQLPQEVVVAFAQWIKAPTSRIMWVEGPPALTADSALSLAAVQVCDVSLGLGIPCVSYFLRPKARILPTASGSAKQAACVAMFYSFVFQLIQLLPHDFAADSEGELGEQQFQRLDGTLESINVALEMIDELFDHATPDLLWVVDGFQWAEDSETAPYLRGLLRILRLQQKQRTCKVLFTTQGQSSVLQGATVVSERVTAARMAQGRPGALLRGGSSVQESLSLQRFL